MSDFNRQHVSLEQMASSSLALPPEWSVAAIEWEVPLKVLQIRLSPSRTAKWQCAVCSRPAPLYDVLEKTWRHLDLWSFESWVHASIPRTNCPTHGVRATLVPWAEPRSRLTRQLADLATALLRQHPVGTAASVLRLSWDQAKRLKQKSE